MGSNIKGFSIYNDLMTAVTKQNVDALVCSLSASKIAFLVAKYTGQKIVVQGYRRKIELRQDFGRVYFIGFL